MRLIACHIDNFGKLSNMNINFNDGINIINQPNGWGKSTLAAFLKAMLYGFDTKKEPGAFEKERKLYKPWQGGSYGGELDFEVAGVGYRVSRTFGLTEKQDEFHVYRLKTMIECDDFSPLLGEELFDLDRNSFKRSIYIAQADCVAVPSDGINAKLGNLAENTNDINNFETASADIKDMMNKMSPNRITGSIKKRVNTITSIEQELKKYQAAEDSLVQITNKIEEKDAQKKELQKIRTEYGKALQTASADSRRQALKANYENICSDEKEKKDIYMQFSQRFRGRIPSDEELAGMLKNAKELENLKAVNENMAFTDEQKEHFDSLKEIFRTDIPTDEDLDEMQQKINNLSSVSSEYSRMEIKLSQMTSLAMLTDPEEEEEKRPVKSHIVPAGIAVGVLGIIMLLASVIINGIGKNSFGIDSIILYITAAIGAISFITGIGAAISGNRKYKKAQSEYIRRQAELDEERKKKEAPIIEMKDQLKEIESGIKKLEQDADNFFKKYGIEIENAQYQEKLFELRTNMHDYEKLLETLEKNGENSKKCSELETELEKYMNTIGAGTSKDFISELSALKSSTTELRFADKNFKEAQHRREQFEAEHDMESILSPAECPYTIDELNNLIAEVENSMDEVRTSISQYTRQMEDLQEQLDLRDEKEQEYRNCIELQNEEKHKYEILSLTADYLSKAKEQFTARYMAPIADGFQKYFGILTNNTDRNWQVDANITLKVKEQGQLRDTRTMSAGYQDLIGICMRLALADAMYPGEKPFLIFDDPFVNLDDEKLARGKNLLLSLEREYQVIYFTCHGSREYNNNNL